MGICLFGLFISSKDIILKIFTDVVSECFQNYHVLQNSTVNNTPQFTFMHLADTFIQSDLFRLYICIVSMCVPWESNPQPLRC